jgi:hypothetical protein
MPTWPRPTRSSRSKNVTVKLAMPGSTQRERSLLVSWSCSSLRGWRGPARRKSRRIGSRCPIRSLHSPCSDCSGTSNKTMDSRMRESRNCRRRFTVSRPIFSPNPRPNRRTCAKLRRPGSGGLDDINCQFRRSPDETSSSVRHIFSVHPATVADPVDPTPPTFGVTRPAA